MKKYHSRNLNPEINFRKTSALVLVSFLVSNTAVLGMDLDGPPYDPSELEKRHIGFVLLKGSQIKEGFESTNKRIHTLKGEFQIIGERRAMHHMIDDNTIYYPLSLTKNGVFFSYVIGYQERVVQDEPGCNPNVVMCFHLNKIPEQPVGSLLIHTR